MKSTRLFLPPVLATALVAAADVPNQVAGAPLEPVASPTAAPPALLLNEVYFDPPGIDGSAIGAEWVELYSTRATDVGGCTLEDNEGNTIGTLPNLRLPAYSLLTVFVRGDLPRGFDSDPDDRLAAVALGLTPGDYLDNHSGGVRLRGADGVLHDELYWSDTGVAPSGAGNAYFDFSFASGKPMAEGESLGRAADPLTNYTGRLVDWERGGGVNAAGATPGGRNGVEVTDMTGLKLWAQTGVNQIVTGFGNAVDPDWFSFRSSKIENSVYDYAGDTYTVRSKHTFVVEVWGQVTLLRGPITAVFTRDETAGSVGYQLSATGNLNSALGFGFSFTHTEDFSGFHTNSQSVAASTDVIYRENGQDYPFSITGVTTTSWSGDGRLTITDGRTVQDYGRNDPKLANSQRTLTRLGDGSYLSVFDLTRDREIGAPHPSMAGTQVSSGVESFHIETLITGDDMGQILEGRVKRFERFENGAPILSLANGQEGSFGFGLSSGTPGQYPQELAYQIDLPLVNRGAPLQVAGSTTGRTWIDQGKLLSDAHSLLTFNGVTMLDQHYFVDPVLQACKHCPRPREIHLHQCRICDPPAPEEPAPPAPEPRPAPAPKTVGGFMKAAATCSAAGAGLGTGIGGMVGFCTAFLSTVPTGPGALVAGFGGAKAGAAIGGGIGTGVGAFLCSGLYLFDKF